MRRLARSAPNRGAASRAAVPPLGLAAGLIAVLLAPAPLSWSADVLQLVSGKTVEGHVLTQTESYWVVLTRQGIEAIERPTVRSVVEDSDNGGRSPAPDTADAPEGSSPEADGGPTRRLELALVAKILDEDLEPDDGATVHSWRRFLTSCRPPIELAGVDEEGKADYRVTLEMESTFHRKQKIYDLELGSVYRCRLSCKVERLVAGGKREIADLSLVEDVAGPDENDAADLAREAYMAALDRLYENLSGIPEFGVQKSPAKGDD